MKKIANDGAEVKTPMGIYKQNDWLAVTINMDDIGQHPYHSEGGRQVHRKFERETSTSLKPRNAIERYMDVFNDYLTIVKTLGGIYDDYDFVLETSWYGRIHLHGRVRVMNSLLFANQLYYLRYMDKYAVCVKPEYDVKGWKEYFEKDIHSFRINKDTKLMNAIEAHDAIKKAGSMPPKEKEVINFFSK